jgi:hypothetical protein
VPYNHESAAETLLSDLGDSFWDTTPEFDSAQSVEMELLSQRHMGDGTDTLIPIAVRWIDNSHVLVFQEQETELASEPPVTTPASSQTSSRKRKSSEISFLVSSDDKSKRSKTNEMALGPYIVVCMFSAPSVRPLHTL